MSKRSKDPFEVFKQATLGSGSALSSALSSKPKDMPESDTVEAVQELVDTTPDWKERCSSIMEHLISIIETGAKENNILLNQVLEMQRLLMSMVPKQ